MDICFIITCFLRDFFSIVVVFVFILSRKNYLVNHLISDFLY